MDTFFDSYSNCFRKYATFKGRSARQEYAVFTVVNLLLSLILGLIPVVGMIFSLAIIIPGFAVSVRRIHDLDKSGWWLFAPYALMIIGIIFSVFRMDHGFSSGVAVLLVGGLWCLAMAVWMLFFKGTIGANRFGDEQNNQNDHTKTDSYSSDVTSRLVQAKKMLDDGVVSENEYQVMRKNIINDA